MINHSSSPTKDLINKKIRYSSRSVAPTVNRYPSSRYETKASNGKAQKIIHVSIRSFKSRNTNNHLHSNSIADRQTQSATYSVQTNDISLNNERNDEIIFQTNYLSPKTSGSLTHEINNSAIKRTKISYLNTKDLGEYSGERNKKRCPRIMTCKCSWALIFISTALLLALAIAIALVTTLIKHDTTTTTATTTTTTTITTTTTTTETTTTTSTITTTETTTTTDSSTTTTTTTKSTTVTTTVTTSTTSTTSTTPPSSTTVNTATSGNAYYGQEKVTVSCLTTLKNITIQIFVQKTVGATYSGASNGFWSGTINQTYTTNSTYIIYTWTIISGQTITCSSGPYQVTAQFSLSGTSQVTSADTYIVTTTTSAGVTTTLTGHF